jgi:putative intracellular protease/amidase
MMRKRVGVLIYRDVQALDIAGPMDAFAAASAATPGGRTAPAYEVFTVAPSSRMVVAESGLTLRPQHTFESCPPMDTLVIPGGSALREPRFARTLSPWILDRAGRTRRIAAICTGTFALAATGLLRNRRVTTHWRYARDLSDAYPELQVDATALFLKDGRFYTSAGITAGIDLTLALIEEDLGRAASVRVARELVVYLPRRRPGPILRAARIRGQIDRLVCGVVAVDCSEPASKPDAGRYVTPDEPQPQAGITSLQGSVWYDSGALRREPANDGSTAPPAPLGWQHQARGVVFGVSKRARFPQGIRAHVRHFSRSLSGALRSLGLRGHRQRQLALLA